MRTLLRNKQEAARLRRRIAVINQDLRGWISQPEEDHLKAERRRCVVKLKRLRTERRELRGRLQFANSPAGRQMV